MDTAKTIKQRLNVMAQVYNGPELSRGQKGATIGALNKALGGDIYRHYVIDYLFGVKTSHSLSCGQFWALYEWVALSQDEDTGEWVASPEFISQSLRVLSQAVKDAPPQVLDPLLDGMVIKALYELGATIVDVQVDDDMPDPHDLF